MSDPAHKNRTKPFEDLTYSEQAKSFSAMTTNLKKSVPAHIRKARQEPGPKGEKRDPNVTRDKCIAQIERMLTSLKRKYSLTIVVAALLATGQHGYAQNGTGPGSVDLPFTGYTNVTSTVRHLAARNGGGFFVVQGPRLINSQPPSDQLFAVTASGQRDTAFQPFSAFTNQFAGTAGLITSVVPLADGRVFVAGELNFPVGNPGSYGLALLRTNGTLDTSFAPNFVSSYVGVTFLPQQAVVQQPDGKILAKLDTVTYNGFTKSGISRFALDGALDTSFHYSGTGAKPTVSAMHVLPDGKILIAGGFTNVNGVTKSGVARLNADGTLDTSYSLALGGGSFGSILPTPGGKVLLVGQFTSVGGVNTTNIARLNQDGTVDGSFVCAAFSSNALLKAQPIIQADGKIIIGGAFTNVGGLSRNGVARLNADGSLDTAFDSGTGVSAGVEGSLPVVYSMLQQLDGKVLIGGPFYDVNGVQHQFLARLNGDGGPVVSQSTNAGNITLSVATSGTGLTYQWQVNGTNLIGATEATFTVTNFAAGNAGRYSVIVSNSAAVGVIVSQSAVLRSFGDLRMFAGMSIAGEAGDRYRIEAADIVPGVTNWVTVTTFTHPGGTFLYTDPNSPGRPQRYYRAVLLP